MRNPVETTWEALALELGVTRVSLRKWAKLEGAPKTRDADEWAGFIEAQGLGNAGPKSLGSAELKDENIRLRNERLQVALARDKKQVIPIDEINSLHLHMATRLRSLLYQFMETEMPPKLDGLAAAQMRPILRETADTLCTTLGEMVADWEKAK